MRSAEYWARRSERTLLAAEKQGEELRRSLISTYASTARQLQQDIDAFYGRYATVSKITIQEAQQRLNTAELRSFKQELARYLDECKHLGLGKEHRDYLRSLSGRAYISRQQELLAQVRHRLETLFRNQETSLGGTLATVYSDSYYRTVFDMQQGFGIGADFARLNVAQIDAMIKKPWLGDNYSSRVWQNKTRLIQQLEQVMPQAFALGQNSRELGKLVADRLGVSANAGERLIRTEVNHACNTATLKGYQETGVTQYQYLATLDNRTSDICAALDGKVFRVADAAAGVNYPPMHPNCRSTTVPYFEPDELDTPSVRAARRSDGRYYTVPAEMTYKEWHRHYVGLKLTAAEEYAINQYIGSMSYTLNQKLRNSIALTDDEREMMRNLDAAVDKLPKYEGTVQRSLYFFFEQDKKDYLMQFASGRHSSAAYTSSSTGVYDDNDHVRLIIKSKGAADLRSYNEREQEILFGRNTEFKVIALELIDGKPTIYLEEI